MRSNKIVRSKAVFKFGLLCFLAGVLLSPALAQERTGEINGQVFDQTGAILPGVNVTVTNTASGRALMTLTVDDGSYHARALEPDEAGYQSKAVGEPVIGFLHPIKTLPIRRSQDPTSFHAQDVA